MSPSLEIANVRDLFENVLHNQKPRIYAMKTHPALAMTIADFCAKYELSGQTRRTLSGDYDARTRTVRETLESQDFWKMYRAKSPYSWHGTSVTDRMDKFTETLVSCGFTALDYPKLPASSVDIKQFRAFGKERLRAFDVRILDTLSNAAINKYRELLGVDYETPLTIDDLLRLQYLDGKLWRLHELNGFRRSIAKTREKLAAIGFRYEDGAFMQQGTRREFVEKLMVEGRLSRKAAQRVADLAARKGWVPKFIE